MVCFSQYICCLSFLFFMGDPNFSFCLLYSTHLKYLCAYALQSVLEEISCHEHQLNRLKEKAQQLLEEQAVSKSFMRRVSQLSSQYLTLSNLTKVKHSVYVLLSCSFNVGGERLKCEMLPLSCVPALWYIWAMIFCAGFKEWEIKTYNSILNNM